MSTVDQQQRVLLTRWLQQQRHLARGGLSALQGLGLLSGLCIASQAWILADLLHQLIVNDTVRTVLTAHYWSLLAISLARAGLVYLREQVSFRAGQLIRARIRQKILDRLSHLGPVGMSHQPIGSWSTVVLDQVENLHDYFARYLPQRSLAALLPVLFLAVTFALNWVAGLILLLTAPLILLFMILVGMGAAEANRRNFLALSRLSGHFLDRLRGLETLRIFDRAECEVAAVAYAADTLRQRTMAVLRLAFVSSTVLEFFTMLSIALVAVYFGFCYLGTFNFGAYHTEITLFSGFVILILAPEFYQPLRDLGTFYHAKAQAVAAAQRLVEVLQMDVEPAPHGQYRLPTTKAVHLVARDVEIYSPHGQRLVGPLNFVILAGEHIVCIGASGAGKTSLINLLLGFLFYRGSLTIDGVELRALNLDYWRRQVAWVGQNPYLLTGTVLDNIKLGCPQASEQAIANVVQQAYVDHFLTDLPQGILTPISSNGSELSVGQAQRIAVARALLSPCALLLLDEPTASLDSESEQCVIRALTTASRQQTTLTITHRREAWQTCDRIWLLQAGQITPWEA